LTSHTAERPFVKTSNIIYPAILANLDIPLLEKSQSRLEDNTIFLIFTGTDAPSQTIAITIFHILNNLTIYQKLKKELFAAIPDITATLCIDQLEQIPYLVYGNVISCLLYYIGLIPVKTATIKEGLRLASIIITRLPRSAPDEVLRYKQWDIPAGVYRLLYLLDKPRR
jgi:cytochrome P450